MKINKYNQFINEKNSTNDESINEELGWKDILMGVALLAGTLGTAQQAKAQEVIKDKGDQISAFLSKEDENTIVKQLQDAGYTKAAAKLQSNQISYQDLVSKIGKKDKDGAKYSKETDKIPAGNLESLKNHLMSGFAITSAEKKVLRDTIVELGHPEVTYDTITVNIPTDQLFDQGSFKLNETATKALQDSLTTMKNGGLVITKVVIESSTDKQKIGNAAETLKRAGFESSNKGLSQARNNALKSSLTSIIGQTDIQQIVKSEEGKGEVGAATPQDPSARYVKATFVCVHVNKEKPAQPKVTIKETIKWVLTVAKIVKGYDGYKPHLPGATIKGGGGKAKGGDVLSCPLFK